MCLIAFVWRTHPDFPLVLAANRDEFFERPSLSADFWPEQSDLLAGRDLRKGGTWLGVTRTGRFAAVTNYRQGGVKALDRRSRGELVTDFLTSRVEPAAYLDTVVAAQGDFDGFNLLVGDRNDLFHFSNRDGDPQPVQAGIHGLSNALLNTPWPKVRYAKAALAASLDADRDELIARLFSVLADASTPPDEDLPNTGVSRDWERLLSSAFIESPDYGTRSSTVLLIDRNGVVTFVERTFDAGAAAADRRYTFTLPDSAW